MEEEEDDSDDANDNHETGKYLFRDNYNENHFLGILEGGRIPTSSLTLWEPHGPQILGSDSQAFKPSLQFPLFPSQSSFSCGTSWLGSKREQAEQKSENLIGRRILQQWKCVFTFFSHRRWILPKVANMAIKMFFSMIINITVVMITIFIDIFIVASPKCSFHVLPNFLRFCNLYATRCCHYCIYMQFISTNDELMFLNIDICNSRHWGTWTEAYQWKPCDDIGLWWKEIHFDMWISPSPASWMHYIYQCETYQKNQQDIQKPMQEMIKKMSQSSSKL